MARRIFVLLTALSLVFIVASPASAGSSAATACVGKPYSYAGLQSNSKAHGVSATLVPTAPPSVSDGHVGGWVGVGGYGAGPGGQAEWIQTGFSAFTSDKASHMYYEVTRAGADPHYVELGANVQPGEKHKFAVLEMSQRSSWWRVWLDGKAVSEPIHLPGSHGAWYPQAVAENWNGGTGTCNGYAYGFSNISLAKKSGGDWQPLSDTLVLQDAGYRVVKTAGTPSNFLATSL